jgi:tetratricopeptide (TPR) repeat protein
MKKIAFLLVMTMVVTVAFGQKNVRQTASNMLRSGKLDKALEAINQCIEDPSTSQDAKTWLLRGNIYLEIANTTDQKYKGLVEDPVTQALESYANAVKYDDNKRYFTDIFNKLNAQRNQEYNLAAEAYNEAGTIADPDAQQAKFSEASKGFASAATIMNAVEVVDTASLLYTAYCASLARDYDMATKYYEDLLKLGYNSPSVYVSLSDIYRVQGDKDNAVRVINEGKAANSGNTDVFLQETTVFLTFDMADQALENLLSYIETDTTNYSVYFALGTIHDKFVNDTISDAAKKEMSFEKAVEAYNKTLALNPEYFDAYYNLGALYVNTAAILDVEANALPLDKVAEYEKLKEEANGYLEAAAPYLEKAIAMQPNDMNTLQTLRQIYTRTKQNEKLKEVMMKINALTQ